jgi:hypothetical protein
MAEARTITIRDIQLLADRLLSHGLSKLSNDRPEHAGDLRLAAKVIRAMARSFGHTDVVTLENGNG